MVHLQIGENRVGITWESLTWFLIFTAIGTVLGGVLYAYLAPYLQPFLPKGSTPATSINPATP